MDREGLDLSADHRPLTRMDRERWLTTPYGQREAKEFFTVTTADFQPVFLYLAIGRCRMNGENAVFPEHGHGGVDLMALARRPPARTDAPAVAPEPQQC
ncbi:MAG: hypothetical protein ACLVHV_09375 [Oscillospiraceae bacterium]